MFSLGVSSVDVGASTCDFVLGGVELRGSHSPCVFSVRTISYWLDGGVAVLPRLERSVRHGHELSRFLQPLPVGYDFLNVSLPPAIPTGMPGRVPVRSWSTRVCAAMSAGATLITVVDSCAYS